MKTSKYISFSSIFKDESDNRLKQIIRSNISLKWFLDNFDKFLFNDTKFTIPRFFLKKINSKIHKFLAKSVFPYYVFYCYNNTNSENLE